MYFLLFKIFQQLALALKTELALEFFKPGGAAAPPDPPPRTPMLVSDGFTHRPNKPWPRARATPSYSDSLLIENLGKIAEASLHKIL